MPMVVSHLWTPMPPKFMVYLGHLLPRFAIFQIFRLLHFIKDILYIARTQSLCKASVEPWTDVHAGPAKQAGENGKVFSQLHGHLSQLATWCSCQAASVNPVQPAPEAHSPLPLHCAHRPDGICRYKLIPRELYNASQTHNQSHKHS